MLLITWEPPMKIEGDGGGWWQGRTQDFKLGAGDKQKKKFQICIHIVLINYEPRQIPKNHCFLINYQLFEIVFERYGYFPELGYWHFLELGNEYFLRLEHRHFLELENEYFLELEYPHFL